MAIGPAIKVQEAVVSGDTAIACLVLLSSQVSGDADIDEARSRWRLHDTLTLSELIEAAGDFGFRAQYTHRNWTWLQQTIGRLPLILILKNSNAIVAVETGRTGAQEIVVLDPLHRGGALIVVPQASIEDVWDGDVVILMPGTLADGESAVGAIKKFPTKVSERSGEKGRLWWLFSTLLCLIAVSPLLAALLVLPLTQKPLVSSLSAPPVPAFTPVHRSTVGKGLGHLRVAGRPIFAPSSAGSIVSSASGIMAAETLAKALGNPLPRTPKTVETSVVEAIDFTVDLTDQNQAQPDLHSVWLGKVGSGALTLLSTGPQKPDGSSLPVVDVLLSPGEATTLVARGDERLQLGDVASARLFYERAANGGDSTAALRLAETYDPIFLIRTNLTGVSGDMAKALSWYQRARNLGSDVAGNLLTELEGKLKTQ
jgi:hypothetical protein